MPKVRIGDAALHYVEAGAGEPLVLIMGLSGDHLAWGFQLQAFAQRHRVLAFDNRGAGQTEAPDAPCTIATMAADALGLMDAVGIERAHVVGVSMGGMIAQELALAAPDRVRTLHLGCTLARPDVHLLALLATWRTVRTTLPLDVALRAMALWLFAPATWNERGDFVETLLQAALGNPYPQTADGFVRQTEAIAGHDTLDRLSRIRCPTLISVGEDDILVPPRFSRELAARIPAARLQTVPAAGHVYFWEQPEAFNALTLDFIARS